MTDRTEREGLALKPCPFCGEQGAIVLKIQGFYHVACQSGPDCRCYGPQEMSPRAAIAAWNRRPTEDLAGKGGGE